MEKELIQKALSGEQKAYKELYDIHKENIRKRILYMIRNESDAEEITQNVFIKAFGSLEGYKDYSFSMWLRAIATNMCIDYFRLKKSKLEYTSLDEELFKNSAIAQEPNILEQIESIEISKELEDLINSLYYKHRNLLKKRYYENMSYEQLAEYFEVSVGTIKSNLHIAHKKLKDSYNKQKQNKNNGNKKPCINHINMVNYAA